MVGNINLSDDLAIKVNKLSKWLKDRKHVLIMLSGGLDSGVLAYTASQVIPEGVYAVTVRSVNIPADAVSDALQIAEEFNLKHRVIDVDVLSDPMLESNPKNRCYICKKTIIRNVKKIASELNIECICDGTNTDDLKEYRPGRRAVEEEGVCSPLALFGFSKSDLRVVASAAGLFFKDKKPESCLFTRFPYNRRITEEDFKRVYEAERTVKDTLGVEHLRVRDFGSYCKIELDVSDFERLSDVSKTALVVAKLKKLGYTNVYLDLEGYKSGSMDKNKM
ncbi:MAG: ATP-dependent sacrificial sulfur transferase LarE [Candidatus Odinarchaeia archaeon]